MTAFAIVTGSLFKAPSLRASKTGRPYVTATIRAKDGEASQWWRVMAFSESAQVELMRLGEGDACTVQGAFKCELYQPEGGEARISLSIVADHVLALRQPPRKRKAKTAGDAARGGAAAFDDSIPFGAA